MAKDEENIDTYLSHGCIRLERPFELGVLLLGSKLDTAYLRERLRGQQPAPVRLDKPVPVFVLYLRAGVDGDGLVVAGRACCSAYCCSSLNTTGCFLYDLTCLPF
jgi:hypothetical protein